VSAGKEQGLGPNDRDQQKRQSRGGIEGCRGPARQGLGGGAEARESGSNRQSAGSRPSTLLSTNIIYVNNIIIIIIEIIIIIKNYELINHGHHIDRLNRVSFLNRPTVLPWAPPFPLLLRIFLWKISKPKL